MTATTTAPPAPNRTRTPAKWLEYAVQHARPGTRNDAIFRALCQMRDDGYTEPEALAAAEQLAARMGEGYEVNEARATVKSVYSKPPRPPAARGNGAPRTAPAPSATAATPSTTAPDAEQRRAEFIANAPAHWVRAIDRLLTPEGAPAREYLAARGIHPKAAHLCGIGYTLHAYDPQKREHRPALVFGHETLTGELMAVNYRFLGGQADGLRYSLRTGSLRAGLYMPPRRPNAESLIICEGELNAASIWQATAPQSLPVDTASIGAQGVTAAQLAQLATLAARYNRAIVWLDEPNAAAELAAALNAKAVKSLTFEGVKYDANALLIDGLQWQQGRFIATPRKMPPLAEYTKHLINS